MSLFFLIVLKAQTLTMQKYILMLEDDADDKMLTEETFGQLNLDVDLVFLSSSDALFSHLEHNSLPELILIDYNSTPEDGLSVLKKIKGDGRWSQLPVVILSDNNLPQYKNECYSAGANSFIRKPISLQLTQSKIETFFRYWFDVVEL